MTGRSQMATANSSSLSVGMNVVGAALPSASTTATDLDPSSTERAQVRRRPRVTDHDQGPVRTGIPRENGCQFQER